MSAPIRRAFVVCSAIAICACGEKSSSTPTTPVVSPPVVTQVQVTLARATIQTSDTATATAVVLDQRGQPMTGQTVAWQSSSVAVASVGATGLVFGESSGPVTISALVGGKTGGISLAIQKSPRYKKWLAIKALGDSVRALRVREGTWGTGGEVDLDADGDIDLFLFSIRGSNETPYPFRVFRNLGDTLFVREETGFSALNGSNGWVVRDFDGDGRDDIFVPNFGVDLPPFPGARQQLFLQTAQGTLSDRTDLMPARVIVGHAGCASKTRQKAMVIGGNANMMMRWTGQRYDEASLVSPAIDYASRPADWFLRNGRAGYMSYWVCAFFDGDGDGIEDVFLGSGNDLGIDTSRCCGPSKDMQGNALGATHAILWGERGTDTLRYSFPLSVVAAGASTITSSANIAYVQRVVADFDGDGCDDIAVIGTDYIRDELVDIIHGCVARSLPRLLSTYRFDIQGSLGSTVNVVAGLEYWHDAAVATDVNGDGIKDLALINQSCHVAECSGNIGMQVRVGVGDGRGAFAWRRAQSTDFWVMPLKAQILSGWTWDPRAR